LSNVGKPNGAGAAALLLLVAVLSASLTGWIRPARAADAPLEINAILSLTGQGAYLGNEELQALRVAQDLVDKTGGIKGRNITFVVADDQTSPQVAVQLANGLIAKKVPVILGLGLSVTCKAVIPLVEANGPLTFCFTPAVDEPPKSYVYGSSVSTGDTIAIGVRYFRERNLKRIGFITATDATGQVAEAALDAALARPENKDMRVVDREHFNVGDVSLSAVIARLKAADPQAIFGTATGPPFGALLHGMRDAGLDVPLYTNNGNATLDQMAQYHDLLPTQLCASGLLGMTPGTVGNGPIHDAQIVYAKAFKAAGIQPSAGHNLAWDATLLTVDAFKEAGANATAAQLRDYIANVHGWTGINGVYNFRNTTQRGIGENGLAVICWNPARKDFVPVTRAGGALR
jgi:branched-chain amino acid transport system substrate-binding protein